MKLSKELSREQKIKMYGQYVKFFKNVGTLMTFEQFLLMNKKMYAYFEQRTNLFK